MKTGHIFKIAAALIFGQSCVVAQNAATPPVDLSSTVAVSSTVDVVKRNETALTHLREEDIPKALEALGSASTLPTTPQDPFFSQLSAASGGLHRALAQLGTDEQFELLHKWSMPNATIKSVRVWSALVPEVSPPMEFARVLGQRPTKESFAVARVGGMPGIFCSAWTMIVAADDAGNLRQLITELEGLAKSKVPNADSGEDS